MTGDVMEQIGHQGPRQPTTGRFDECEADIIKNSIFADFLDAASTDEPRPNNEAKRSEEFMIMSQSPDDDIVMDGASSGGADALFEAEPTKEAQVERDANDAAAMAEQRQQMNISNSSRQGNLANEVMKEVHIYELTGRQN